MAAQYPSCVVKMVLTYDEGGKKTGALYQETAKGAGTPTEPGQSNPSSTSFSSVTVEGRLKQLRKSAAGPNSVLLSLIPSSAEIECLSPRVGDSATFAFDFARCPTDSRTVRSCLVEIYLGTVMPANFSRGMQGWREVKPGQGLPALVEHSDPAAKWLRFLGYADTWKTIYGDAGWTVSVKSRDLTALYLDTKITMDELRAVRLGMSVERVISQIVSLRRATLGTPVIVARGYNKRVTTLETVSRENRGKDGKKQGSEGGTEEISMWDAIVDLCTQNALIPYIDRGELIVRPPSTVFNGETVTGEKVAPRYFVFGRNCKDLEFEHRLGSQQSVAIEYRCTIPTEKRTISARWPITKVASKIKSGGRVEEEKIVTRIVNGIMSCEILQDMARNEYEMQGRQELQGSFMTMDVASYVKGSTGVIGPKADPNADPDVLTMRSGDQIMVLFAATPASTGPLAMVTSRLFQLYAQGRQAMETYLTALGYRPGQASVIARGVEDADKHLPLFVVRNVRYNFDPKSAIKSTVDIMNSVQYRMEKEKPA